LRRRDRRRGRDRALRARRLRPAARGGAGALHRVPLRALPSRRRELRPARRLGAGPRRSRCRPRAPDARELGDAPATTDPRGGDTMTDAFAESFVEADGFRIRYLEAGEGPPLAYFHGGGGLHVSPAYE